MFYNLNSTLKKVLIIFLIITLTYANFALIGNHIIEGLFSYAVEEEEEALVVANQKLVMNKVCEINGVEKRVIQVAVETGIESEEYPIGTTILTLATDLVEGAYEDIKVTELNKNSYTEGTYAVLEGKLLITLVNENETLEVKEKGLDKLLITYVFPNNEIETIKKPLEKVDVLTYKEEALTKECEQAIFEEINVEKEILELNVENKDIHKTTIDNGQVVYTENLNLDLSYRNEATKITIEDISSKFYNNDEQENEEVSLKYIKTVLSREKINSLLGQTGKLVITDTTTNKELITLTSEKLAKEEAEKQYYVNEQTEENELRSELSVVSDEVIVEYSIDVTNLKIEIIDIVSQSMRKIDISDFVIKNTKSISAVNDVEILKYLIQNVKYTVEQVEKTVETKITFKDTTTRANVEVDKNEWILGQANKVNYTITLDTTTEKSELFINPMFLIELPSSVESINTENSEFTVNNDGGVFINKKVFPKTVLGKKVILIILEGEQTNQSIENGNTTIDLTLELNISDEEIEGIEKTKLYYQNNTVTSYENGKSFDSADIDIHLILQSEEKEEIGETNTPEQDEIEENVFVRMTTLNEGIIKQLDEIQFRIYVENYSTVEKENAKLIYVLPEGLTFNNVVELVNAEDTTYTEKEVEYSYDEQSRTLTINIDKLEAIKKQSMKDIETGDIVVLPIAEVKEFKLNVIANKLPEGVYSKEIKNSAKVQIGENTYLSEEVVYIVSDKFLEVETKKIENSVNEKEGIEFEVRITNKGLINAYQVEYTANIPDSIKLFMVEYGIVNEEKSESTVHSNEYKQSFIDIPAGKTYFIKLKGNVKDLDEGETITATGVVDEQQISWETELVNVPDIPTEPENPTNPDEPTGPEDSDDPKEPIAPEDTEKPKDPEDTEEPVDPENPNNPNNPNKPENPTDSENKEDEEDKEDLDGINKEELVDGFDLKLEQYLNQITVTNEQGTTTYDYTNTNFAKVEIHSKYMNGSKVNIKYDIVVKNNGTIPGYARKIADYLPEGLTFNQELNKDWYFGDDGNIYSVALIDKLLNPGETAKLSIILEKQMTNESTGNITNIVEIYEATNDQDVEDINSIPGDKLEGQNDISKVEVIIATSTGTIILYITLTIVVSAIIGFGFYKVKKVILNKKGGC